MIIFPIIIHKWIIFFELSSGKAYTLVFIDFMTDPWISFVPPGVSIRANVCFSKHFSLNFSLNEMVRPCRTYCDTSNGKQLAFMLRQLQTEYLETRQEYREGQVSEGSVYAPMGQF